MMRTWLSRAVGLFAGASVAALLAAVCGGSEFSFSSLLLPILVGNGLIAGGVLLMLTLLSIVPALRARLGGAGVWAAVGFGASLIPVPLQFGLGPTSAFALGGTLAIGIVLLAWWRLPAVRLLPLSLIFVLTVGGAIASGFYHDSQLRAELNRLAEAQLTLPPSESERSPAPRQAPDVFLISIDTLRADALVGPRPAGYELPFLDSLREAGTGWDYALSSSNQTVPGHAGMFLGRDAMGTGVRWNHDVLPGPDFGTLLAERFLAGGFRTAGVISNGLLSSAGGFARGFELFDDTTVANLGAYSRPLAYLEGHTWLGLLLDPRIVEALLTKTLYFSATKAYRNLGKWGLLSRGELTSNQTLTALDQLYAQDRPFFCFVHYMDPHQPYGAPAPYAGRLTKDLPPYAERYRPTARQGMFALDEIDRAAQDLRSSDPTVRAEAELVMRWFHLTYLEKLMFLDAQIQRVHERAAASGRPAVWLLTGDHGEHFGEHGVVLHGTTLYEELLRVPFILTYPGVAPGVPGTGVPRLEDVAPTLLALAGLVPGKDLKGRILSREGAASAEMPHMAADNKRVAVREGGWKQHGIWTSLTEVKFGPLFQLSNDPGEGQDRSGAAAPASLLAALAAFIERDLYPMRHDLGPPNRALERQLLELGYVDGLIEQ